MDRIDQYLMDHDVDPARIGLLRRPVAHWIAGQPVLEGTPLPVFEPSTGGLLCEAHEAGETIVNAAVQAARRALADPGWADLRPLDRQALILRLADLIEAHAEELALIESVDVGKPVALAQEIDIGGSLDVLRYFAGLACRVEGRAAPMAAYPATHFGMTYKAPLGVVGAIVPWNFPLQTLIWKSAAALAAGCTLVIKPSEITPLSALRFAELADQAGFPAGVINVVNGTGPVTGAALVAHPDVAKITFTGSTDAGRRVGQSAMQGLKRITLELGGKSPVLVTQHADLDQAADGVLNGIFFNSGQVCDAGSRVIVQSSVHDEFLARLVDKARGMVIAAGLEPDGFMGPLASQAHLDKVQSYAARARADELDLALDLEATRQMGFWHGPVIVRDCPLDHPIWTDEIFGPILAVRRAETLDDMLRLAHDTRFGLGAAVFSHNQTEVMHLTRRLRAGTIYVNGHGFLDPAFPFGGSGQSGFGKDLGPEQLDAYLETRTVLFDTTPVETVLSPAETG